MLQQTKLILYPHSSLVMMLISREMALNKEDDLDLKVSIFRPTFVYGSVLKVNSEDKSLKYTIGSQTVKLFRLIVLIVRTGILPTKKPNKCSYIVMHAHNMI